MRLSHLTFATLSLVVAACAFSVTAADPKTDPKADVPAGPDPGGLFTRLDADKDGQVTLAEAGSENTTLFNRLVRMGDKNKDGKLSRDEFVAGLTQKETTAPASGGPGGPPGGFMPDPEMMFNRLDANKDGKLTLEEVPAERREMFERGMSRFDKDSNKSLSLAEYKEMMSQFGGGGGPAGGELLKRIMEGDKNGDGKLSKEELPERMRDQFDKIDANNDGFVSRDEILRRLANMAEKGKGKGLEKRLEKKKD